jgi:membrane protein DedA with SNARE-associated domain
MLACVFASIVDVAGNVGLPLLFALVMLESTGIPLPGEAALFAAAILASKGKLAIEEVIVVAALAAIIGDNFGYLIGRRYGRRVLSAPGPFADHRQTALRVGDPFFAHHGTKAVFFGRFFAGLRITAAWMAGITRMPWRSFLVWNAAGGILWATLAGLLGYFAGHAAERIFQTVGLVGLVAFVAGLVVLGVWRFRAERRRLARMLAAAPEPAAPEPEPDA